MMGPMPGVHCGPGVLVGEGVACGVPEMTGIGVGLPDIAEAVGCDVGVGFCWRFWFWRFVTFDKKTVKRTGIVSSAVINSRYRFLSGKPRYQSRIRCATEFRFVFFIRSKF